jgi:membrane fusion protein (multidrug efflux system)
MPINQATNQNLAHADNNLTTATSRSRSMFILKGIALAAIIAAAIGGLYAYSVYYPNTDDAYVGTNLLDVSAKVGGFVQNIDVENNQFVKKGQLLLEINPEDYANSLAKAQNNQLVATNQLIATQKSIQVAEANLNKAQSDSLLARQLATRYQGLYQTQAGSQQDMQTYIAKAQIATQQVKQDQALLEQAKEQYKASQAQLAVASNEVQNAKNFDSYTQVIAPVDGYVTDLNLVKGQLVKAGDPIFGFVDNSKWWIDANFKETQLNRIRLGQPCEVELDMYNHKYHGVVRSISYASGNTFALLPSENATGNWVKVTQRFTVRIQLQNDKNYPLRVGGSADVTINTLKRA